MDNLEQICLYQLVKPKHDIELKDRGHCKQCIRDDKNVLCKYYYPINIRNYNVKTTDEPKTI